MKIATVVGARPQFIKSALVSKKLRAEGCNEMIIHTGQHYDDNMSSVFFEEMEIPKPDYNLGVGSGLHGYQTGKMMISLEELFVKQKPDMVIVYGDTNSTLAAALVACKLQIPLAHIESGLRSYNRTMPEEHNRVLTDHCSDLHFCPTITAVENLKKEGITNNVHHVGDTMYDATLFFYKLAKKHSNIIEKLSLVPGNYFLATIHRPSNTDQPRNLGNIFEALAALNKKVIFPVHPRTEKRLIEFSLYEKLVSYKNIKLIKPLGYLDMLVLEKNAQIIITDSGGIQKEAFFFGVPCITVRKETEWIETVVDGWNVLVGTDHHKIVKMAESHKWPTEKPKLVYGEGNASALIVNVLFEFFNAFVKLRSYPGLMDA